MMRSFVALGLVLLLSLGLIAWAQAPKPRLSCEEITGGLYIANA